MSAAFITIAAGPSWAPLTTLLSWYSIGYGSWRTWRRSRNLHAFVPWRP
jgi:hypothetical protein